MKVRFSIIAAAAAGTCLVMPGVAFAEEQADPERKVYWDCRLENKSASECVTPVSETTVVPGQDVVGDEIPLDDGVRAGFKTSREFGAPAPVKPGVATPPKPQVTQKSASLAKVDRKGTAPGKGVSRDRKRADVSAKVASGSDLFVTFRLGSAELDGGISSDMRALAQSMVGKLSGGNKLVVQIAGHTDATGDDAANLKLSEDRAQTVRAKLIELGVPAESIQAVGYGETKLIAGYAPTHGINRRVEVNVVN